MNACWCQITQERLRCNVVWMGMFLITRTAETGVDDTVQVLWYDKRMSTKGSSSTSVVDSGN